MTRRSFLLPCALLALLVPVGCGGGGGDDAGSDAGAPDLGIDATFAAPDMDGHGPPVPGLGDACAGELCTSATPCVSDARGCRTGLCLTDPHGPLLGGDYCTTECAPAPCAAGFHCAPVRGSVAAACVADAAVCGDGVLERGEACDDGNTATGDGCDATCHVEPPPVERVSADVSVSGSELSLDGGAPTPRVAVVHVATGAGGDGGCGAAGLEGDAGALPDGGVFEPVHFAACAAFGSADVHATLAWAPGSYDVDAPVGAYQLAVCADLRFADAPGCAQRYCAATGATPSAATWTVTRGDGGVHGMLDGHLVPSGAPVPDSDAGCDAVYGDALDVSAVVDRAP